MKFQRLLPCSKTKMRISLSIQEQLLSRREKRVLIINGMLVVAANTKNVATGDVDMYTNDAFLWR